MIADEIVTQVLEYLEGTTNTVEQFLALYELDDVDLEELEEVIEDRGLEICPCGWWVPSYELVDEDSEVAPCESCREDEEDE